MHIMRAAFVGGPFTDNGLATYKSGSSIRMQGLCFCFGDGVINFLTVMSVYSGNNIPTVGLKPFRGVIREPSLNIAVN